MIEHIKTWIFLCSLTFKAKCFCIPLYNKNKTIGKAYFYWKKKNSVVKYYLPTKALPVFVVYIANHKNIGGDQHFINPEFDIIVKTLKSLNENNKSKDL